MFKQIKLRQQARIDYQQARGTAHKKLLQTVKWQLQKQQSSCEEAIYKAEEEIQLLEIKCNQELENALTHYLVHHRLREIPGIGEVRQAEILRYVFRGKLTDLYAARQLAGIGEQVQTGINQWVRHYQKNFSNILKEGFPGKDKIHLTYQQLISVEKGKIRAAEKDNRIVQKQLDRIQPELAWLEKISTKNFYRALAKPGKSAPELDGYIQGVFAEWEPVPDWFQKILASGLIQQSEGGGDVTAVFDNISTRLTNVRQAGRNGLAVLSILGLICCSSYLLLSSVFDREAPALATTTMTTTATAVPSATHTMQPSATATLQATATTRPSRTSTMATTATVTAEAKATAAPQFPQIRVIVNAANVRTRPDSTAPIVGVARAEDILPVLDANEDESWFLVELPDGNAGWIGSTLVTFVMDDIESP